MRRFKFGRLRLSEALWEAIELLDVGWRRMNRSEIHHNIRDRLERLGFAEFDYRQHEYNDRRYCRGRLTAKGRDYRDSLYRRRADRLNKVLWGYRGLVSWEFAPRVDDDHQGS